MKRIVLSVLSLVLLCSCQFTGGSAGGATAGTPTNVSIASASLNNDPVDNEGPIKNDCNSAPGVAVLPATWTTTFTNGAVSQVSFQWPKGLGYTASLNFQIMNGASNFYTDFSNAVQQWDNALAADAPGILELSPQLVTSGAQVAVYEASSVSENGEGGTESFGQIPGGSTVAQTNIQSATINIGAGTPYGDQGLYSTSAHEIGHALGLNHSNYTSSIMYYALDNPDQTTPACYASGASTAINSYDLSYLLNTYDPTWSTKNKSTKPGNPPGSGPPGACHTTHCTMAQPVQPYNAGVAEASRGIVANAYQGTGPTDLGRVRAENHEVSIHLDDHTASGTVSLPSLYLASTLVARVKSIATVASQNSGAFTYFIRAVRVTGIARHLLGPDQGVSVGQTILVEDRQPASTHFFLDDPPLIPGIDAVLFLSKATFGSIKQPVYFPTMTRISKIGVSQDGYLYVAGNTTAKTALTLNGSPESKFLDVVLNGRSALTSPSSQISEIAVLTSLLKRSGVSTSRSIAQYAAAMSSGQQPKLLRLLKQHDLQMMHAQGRSYFSVR